jgi:hypothetical protein
MMTDNGANYHNDNSEKKHENGDAVDPMHVTDPGRMWLVGSALAEIKITG